MQDSWSHSIQIPVALLIAGGAAASRCSLLLTVLLWRERRRRRRAERSAAEVRSQLQTVTATMREGGHRLRHGPAAQVRQSRPSSGSPATRKTSSGTRSSSSTSIPRTGRRSWPSGTGWPRVGALRDQEYRVVTRTGQIRWCSSSWEPMRDETGRQIGYMGTEFDITERKLAEEAMRLGYRALPGGARGGAGGHRRRGSTPRRSCGSSRSGARGSPGPAER